MSDKPTYEELEQRVQKLEESERKLVFRSKQLESLMNNNAFGIVSLDKGMRIVGCNEAFEDLFLYAQSEMEGKTLDELIVDGDLLEKANAYTKTTLTGKSIQGLGQRRRKDSALINVKFSGIPITVDGEVIGAYGIYENITAITQAEEKLRESEGNLRSIFENMQDIYYKLDANGKILVASPSAVKLYKYDSLDEMIGKQADDFVYNVEDSQKFTKELRRKGHIKSYIIKHKCKNGDPVFVEANTNLIFDDQGNPEGSVGVFRDISERLKAEEALRESETKYRVLFELMTQGAFRQRADGRLIDVNPAALEMFGLTRDKFLGRTSETPVWDVVHEDGSPFNGPEHPSMVALSTGKAVSGVVAGVLNEKTQERVWVEINAIPEFRPDENNPYQVMVTMHDFTESKRAEMSLQREKENLSTTLENNPNGIVLFDNNGKWIYGNPMLTEMTGYTAEDIQTGREWFQKAYPDAGLRKKVIDAWKKDRSQLEKGEVHEFDVTCKDGQVKQIEFSVTHLADRSVSVLTDVTQRKKIEKSLYEAKLFLDNISDLAYRIDNEGKVIYANPAVEKITGVALGEIIDRPFLPHFSEKNHNLLLDVYNKTLAGERQESILTFKSGITCHFTSLPFKDNHGNIIGTFGIARDISDRIDADMALKESEARLKKAQTVAKLGNWEYDISTGKVWGSEQAFRIYGIERTSPYLPLDRVEACIPDAPRVNQALVDLLQESKRYDMEFEIRQEVSGQTILIHSIAELVYENGLPIKVLGVIRDVTEQKKAEKERKHLEDQLQHAQKMEAIGTLAGGVAHDLNNILGGLVSYPELLLLQLPEDSPLRKSILTIQSSGEKAAAVVQDLLTLARRGVVVTEVVKLNNVIAQYLKSPEYEKLQSYHPTVHMETHLEKDTLNILGSSIHLSKTVMNLVSNAAEAMLEGGTLSISTENRYIDRPIGGYNNVKEGDYVVLIISDTGMGISPDDINKIFEPFYTKKKMGRSGTGLGMAVVWGTVKDHNGYIHVQSTEGKGTTFTLYFPVTRKSLEERPETTLEDYMGKGEVILVMDDVEAQRKIASGMLKELGYSVEMVSSGEEAVEYLKTNKADLLLLDMIMDPGMDGLETYKKILKMHPGQKAVIASGFSETDRVKELQSLGAGAYIKKPFLLEKIGLAVKDELEK